MTAAVMAETRTAAAARSFTFLMSSLRSEHTKSDRFSTAELIISKLNTSPIANITATHSIDEILNSIPATTTHTVAKR